MTDITVRPWRKNHNKPLLLLLFLISLCSFVCYKYYSPKTINIDLTHEWQYIGYLKNNDSTKALVRIQEALYELQNHDVLDTFEVQAITPEKLILKNGTTHKQIFFANN